MKNDTLHIRVTKELKQQLQEKANDLGINLSCYITMILTQNIKKGME